MKIKITNVYGANHRSAAQKASEDEARRMFQDWKPGPEELLASGKWKGPVVVEGQEDFWKAIRQLRAFREAQGWTLKDVSRRCGIDIATLSKLENGKQTNPTLFTMLLYVGALGKRLRFSIGQKPQPTFRRAETRSVGSPPAPDGVSTPPRRDGRAKRKRKSPAEPAARSTDR